MDKKSQVEEWFLAFADDVYNFLVYYTGNLDVEDLVQETFIKALKGIGNFHATSSPKTWLFAIARNTAINYLKRHPIRNLSDEALLNIPSKEKSPEELVELNDTTQYVFRLLGGVNLKYREVLILQGVHGMSNREIAEVLGWTPSRVSVMLHRAIKAAQKVLSDEDAGREINGVVR